MQCFLPNVGIYYMISEKQWQGHWKEVWAAATLIPFAIVFFLNWLFGSSGGWMLLSQLKLLLLFAQCGFVTAYFIRHDLKKAAVNLWVTLVSLVLLSLIVPVLAGKTGTVLDMMDTAGEISTPLYLFMSCLTAAWLIPGRARKVVRFICVFLFLIYILIQFTYIGYYLTAHALLSVNMMLALAQTNLNEALSFISVNIPYAGLIAGIITLFFLGYVLYRLSNSSFDGPTHVTRREKIIMVIFLCINLVLTGVSISETRFSQVVASSTEILKSFAEYQQILANRKNMVFKDPTIINQLKSAPDGVYVLIIGESLTRDHMGVYGYDRDNTPFQSAWAGDDHFTFFNRVYSSYTQTVQCLSYALTQKNQYNDVPLVDAYSIIDMARAAGFKTTWISNQSRFGVWDTPIGAIGSECDDQYWINQYLGTGVETKEYDSALLPYLRKVDPSNRRQLIVIHLMGSHVSYWDRYPHEFYRYPLDQSKQRTGDQIMIDEYDNSVLFNDFVLKGIMDIAIDQLHADNVIYFSDHGERVVAKPGHNADQFNFMMVHIPFWIYTSDEYAESHPERMELIKSRTGWLFTNDMLYDTLMGNMGLTADRYDATDDFFGSGYNKSIKNLFTMYGNIPLADDTKQLGDNFPNPFEQN
jgi:heptose-I-phosphate ethanolaminephosphotransferase